MELHHPRCPFCHDGVAPQQAKVACDACMTWHHAECWRDHGTCSACGANRPLGRAVVVAASAAPEPTLPAVGCPDCGSRLEGTPVGVLCTGEACRCRFLDPDQLAAALEAISPTRAEAVWEDFRGGNYAPAAACPRCQEAIPRHWVATALSVRACPGHGLWVDPDLLALLVAARRRDPAGFHGLQTVLHTRA